MQELTPREIVAELDRHIVGQNAAKRAVAIALRNRWRWRQLPDDMRKEVTPKNIIMSGPTGVGKTEITRRLAGLTGAPFIKVEATKYTEVGYYGRDVESIIRDLVEASINMVRERKRSEVEAEATERTENRLLDLLLHADSSDEDESHSGNPEKYSSESDAHFEPPWDILSGLIPDSLIPGRRLPVSDDPHADSDVEVSDGAKTEATGKAEASNRPTDAVVPENLSETQPETSDPATDSSEQAELKQGADERQARKERERRTREKFREMLQAGALEDRLVELRSEQRSPPVQIFSNMGLEQMDVDIQGMIDRLVPRESRNRELKISEARQVILEQEIEALIDKDTIQEEALRLAESSGVIFIDEIDKVCTSNESSRGSDVSRQGVQRDLLPIVEGTTVQTKYGSLRTDFMLFIAAGAFHRARLADMMPELQGRFPIRVELSDLTREDFVRILTEPNAALTKQYQALLAVEGVTLTFAQDGIDEIAKIAFDVNQTTQNIGARRLHTIIERLLEEISFDAPDMTLRTVNIDAEFVRKQLEEITASEDLSQFIL